MIDPIVTRGLRRPRWTGVLVTLAALLGLTVLRARAATEVAPSNTIPQHSLVAETSHVMSASPAQFHGAMITTGAVAGYFMLLNATSDPGNGAVSPMKCIAVGAAQTVGISPDPDQAWLFSVGAVLVFSTTGCFVETQSATAFFSWQ